MTRAEFRKRLTKSLNHLKRSLQENEPIYYKEWMKLEPEERLEITVTLHLEKHNAPKQKH